MLPVITTRYQLLEAIGSGGMGTVYSAYDRLLLRRVALKRVATSPVQGGLHLTLHFRFQLAEEFRVLAALRHPHIVQVLDYGFDQGGYPYFTMELLSEAAPLLAAAQHCSFVEKVKLLWQVMQALQYLHRHATLHRDLKPNNILVVDGQVKVLDFGLATSVGKTSNHAGTLSYMSPEVIQHQPVTERSDLYSLAVIAYEMFTGQPLYKGLTVPQIMAQVLAVMPDLTCLPIRIAAVLEIALQKEPSERFASMLQFMEALNETLDSPLPLETPEQRESLLLKPRFVGRVEEISLLQAAWLNTQHRKGSGWLIAGESGVGKSRLVAELRTQAFIEGGVVVQGQAVRDGARPFQIWEDVLRWLCFLLPVSDEEIASLLPIAPELEISVRRTLPTPTYSETLAGRDRFYHTVIALISRVTTPLLLIFEDIQWAGSEAQQLLEQVSAALVNVPVLLLATYRDDQAPFPSQSLRHLRLIRLQRFNQPEISELSRAMVGSDDARLITFLQQQTEGNIFFLQEVLRALSEQLGDTLRITSDQLPATIFTRGIEDIAQYRLGLVAAEYQPLLHYAAVIGREIDLPLLKHLLPAADLDLWLSDCAFIVLERVENQWRFTHDKIRESLLLHLPADEKRDLHQQVAAAITDQSGFIPEVLPALVYHWQQAGDHSMEMVTAAMAAMAAEDVFAYEEACYFYTQSFEAAIFVPLSQIDVTRYMTSLAGFTRMALLAGNVRHNLDRIACAQQRLQLFIPQLNPVQHAQLMELYPLLGRIYLFGGAYPQALAAYQEMHTQALAYGLIDLARIASGFTGQALALQGWFAEALPLMQASLPLLWEVEPVDWLWQSCYIALCQAMMGDFSAAQATLHEARNFANRSTLKAHRWITTLLYALLYWQSDRLPEALEQAQQLLRFTLTPHAPLASQLAYGLQGWILERMQRQTEAQQQVQQHFSIVARWGGRLILNDWVLPLYVQLALYENRYDEACLQAHDALIQAYEVNSEFGKALAYRMLAQTMQGQGENDLGAACLRVSTDLLEQCHAAPEIRINQHLALNFE